MEEKIKIALYNLQIEKKGKATIEDLSQEYLREQIKEYECELIPNSFSNGKKIKMTKLKETVIFDVDSKLNLKLFDEKNDIKIAYNILNRLTDTQMINLVIEEKERGIYKILCPNGNVIENSDNEEKIEFDYEVNAILRKYL